MAELVAIIISPNRGQSYVHCTVVRPGDECHTYRYISTCITNR
eukprot:SAG11_NODE_633_length_8047_cov_33.422874_2_plen_43_part_00